MATLESILPLIQPHIPGCPESIALDAIRNACIRFCKDTRLIRETLPADDIISTVDDYTMTASLNNDIVGIVHFLYDERELPGHTEEELDIIDNGWRTADPGEATAYMSISPNRFKLNRVPDETIVGGLIVRIATRPTDTATEVNDILFNDWRETIKYGALSELLEIPEKLWSDMKQSIWYGKRFNFGIQSGKAQSVKGNLKKSTGAVMRSWT